MRIQWLPGSLDPPSREPGYNCKASLDCSQVLLYLCEYMYTYKVVGVHYTWYQCQIDRWTQLPLYMCMGVMNAKQDISSLRFCCLHAGQSSCQIDANVPGEGEHTL